MWSSWLYLRKIKPYQRLALALAVSFLLHLFLLGELGFNFPDLNEERQLIEARLVSVKAAPAIESAKPVVKKVALAKPAPPLPSSPTLSPSVEQPLPVDAISPVADQVAPEVDNPSLEQTQQEEVAIASQPDDALINPNAYKYVETEFDVRTELDAKVDASPAGKAKIVYQLLPNGEQYQLKSVMQAKGLLALFMSDLLQISEGFVISTGLQPRHYVYSFGDKKNKTYSADFDWESRALTLHSAKGDQKLALPDNTQDLLSFMYQFMFVPPLQVIQLSITNGKKLAVYGYDFEGEEVIPTKMGNLSTIHLMRRSDEGDEKTELWLALEYQYVPVKIRKVEKDGKVYELLVTSLKTEPPFTAQ